VTATSSFDNAVSALVLIRDAQRAVEAALRLPREDRAALADQIETVRAGTADVAATLAATMPGADSLVRAGHAIGDVAARPELRPLGGVVRFFAERGSEALGSVAGAAASLGHERDPSLDLSERITRRLGEVGVTTRADLARELGVDARSADFRDALERTLGTGNAEWYGSGTYGLPREQLEMLIAQARAVSEEGGAAEQAAEHAPSPGSSIADLRAAVDGLRSAVATRATGR
jgi:hypothetical protein